MSLRVSLFVTHKLFASTYHIIMLTVPGNYMTPFGEKHSKGTRTQSPDGCHYSDGLPHVLLQRFWFAKLLDFSAIIRAYFPSLTMARRCPSVPRSIHSTPDRRCVASRCHLISTDTLEVTISVDGDVGESLNTFRRGDHAMLRRFQHVAVNLCKEISLSISS